MLVNDQGAFRVGNTQIGSGEFPMLAANANGDVYAAWDVPVSGGVRYSGRPLTGDTTELGTGTGPGRLALTAAGEPVLARPDEDGDIAVTQGGETRKLTTDAPERRHFAAGLVLRDDQPLVLDLVQRRDQSELRLVGEGAPRAPVASVGALRQIEGAVAADGGRIAVVYVSSGRPVLATAAAGAATWRRRVLPGTGVEGTPAVAFSRGRIVAAWAQEGDVWSAVVGTHVRAKRLTRTRDEERDPYVAAGPTGRAFAAWTRLRGRSRTPVPVLASVSP